MSRNPNAPLELAAANRWLQRQEKSRSECLMRHFSAPWGSPLLDCSCENPDRACRSERSGNAAASWCKTNSLFMLGCGKFVFSEVQNQKVQTRAQSDNNTAVENSLWVKRGGLSLTSVSLTVTVVVPESPPRCPPMSLACRSTRYWSWASLSMSGTAVRRIPASQTRRSGGETTDV